MESENAEKTSIIPSRDSPRPSQSPLLPTGPLPASAVSTAARNGTVSPHSLASLPRTGSSVEFHSIQKRAGVGWVRLSGSKAISTSWLTTEGFYMFFFFLFFEHQLKGEKN